jgi:Lon-like protease
MNIIPNVKLKKENWIGIYLLIVPFILSLLLAWPVKEEFVGEGDIVSVQDLGVDGTVHFTYVQSGVSNNLFTKLFVILSSKEEIEFSKLESYEYDNIIAYENYADEDKASTVTSAAQSAGINTNYYNSTEITAKIDEILNNSTNYAGDSFGLMIAIGLVEEWQNRDFSRDNKYTIAGTGTMESDNTVGSVGAIRHKLLTAESNNVDIFFVPKDKDYYLDPKESNQYEAVKVAEEENLNLVVVPVADLDEAISYLNHLR